VVKKESGESALAVRGKGGRSRSRGESDDEDRDCEDCDGGNSKNREKVCYRCGQSGHIARNCVADMPSEVKCRVRKRLSNTAKVAVIEAEDDPECSLFAFSAVDTTSTNSLSLPIYLFNVFPDLVSPNKKKKKKHPKR
jgi:Zinc knuckle